MEAALALMWEESYGAVSIEDICRRADVRKGSFYYFFGSKSDLAVTALREAWEKQVPDWESLFARTRPAWERIQHVCALVYERQLAEKERTGRVLGCPLCSLGSELSTRDIAIRDEVSLILDCQRDYWQRAIEDGQAEGVFDDGDARARADGAMAYLIGLVTQAKLHDDVEILRDLPARMADHLRVRESAVA
jgi:TetR/AcrR family transcriptional regulator, transcriptional repressor for nem operon